MFYPINTLNWATNSYGIYLMDADFYGQDLSYNIQPSFNSCLALCSANSNCTHISYRYSISSIWYTQGECYLKKGPRSQSAATTLVSLQAAILNQSKYCI
jgi:hypothetical protein